MTNEYDYNNENGKSGESSENGVNAAVNSDMSNNFFSSIPNETDSNVSDISSDNFSNMAGNDSLNTNFVMVDRQTEDTETMKARQQVEKEKNKFETKRKKEAARLEKKKAKKEAKNIKGHGIVFKTVRLVVSAAVFGVVALGTMYFTGDTLGLFKNDTKETVVIPTTSVGAGNTIMSDSDSGKTLQTATDKTDSEESEKSGNTVITDVSGVVENVMPSVVAITSTQLVQSGYSGSLYEYYFGNGNNNNQYEEQTGAGSGIIIGQNDTELLIVTNNHVVEGADSLQIQFIDDESVDAAIKGTDSDKDLAVVAVKLSDIKKSTLEQIKVATLGDSDKLKVGEGTIAIGNALGYGQSVTTGVVSALNREVQYENRTMELIQTNAAINPGNSGGALLNSKGEVIGINAAKYSSSSVEGMGFAIPVSSVKDVIEDLMNKETLTKVDSDKKGYLNIYGRDVTSDLSQTYSMPTGVYVISVMEGGAADKAGIEKSNVITKINGETVSSMEDLQNKLEYYEKGTEVTITVQYAKGNEYKEKDVKVTLGEEMK